MKRYTFVLNFGYVESKRLYYFPFTSSRSYKTAKEALVDLATYLREKYFGDDGEENECCIASIKKNAKAKYCADCGNALAVKKFRITDFMDWCSGMSSCSVDGLGEFIDEYYDGKNRWTAGELEGPNPRVVYHAEYVLAAAIGHPTNPEITFEDVCNKRTKEKRESFSYY